MLAGSAWFWFALMGTAVVAFAVTKSRWPLSPRLMSVDRELALLVDRTAVEDLRDQLRAGPVTVHAWSATSLFRGPVLHIERGSEHLRMRLYGEACVVEAGAERPPRRVPGGPISLVRIDELGVAGWLVVLDAPDGRRRYHGWQVERTGAPRGAKSQAA